LRHLSIIDLVGGHQPIINEDKNILVVFNGEIFNCRKLQKELQQLGHQFNTNSDMEVIVHAYKEYGDHCVKHFRGMFTFVLWDRKRQHLLLARDRFGKKPLTYYWDGRRLIFGSEIKSILEAGASREINSIALDEYLVCGYIPAPLLKEAMQVRLMKEAPLGAFLSGGIDSSLVVRLMSSITSQPVNGKKRLRNISCDFATRCTCASAFLPKGSRSSIYSPEQFALVQKHNPFERIISRYQEVSHDVHFYLTDDILVRVDKASRINSLETHAPLLDQYLVEYVSSLPATLRMHNDTLKYLLKKAAADLLPPEILSRRKQGIGVPIKQWFRGDLNNYAYELLDSPRTHQRGIFNKQFIQNPLKTHVSRRMVNLSQAIWALIYLELWFQIYMDVPSMRVEQSIRTQAIG
jgi:asparagine synthetase B (glutamine-hydrolysing)